MSKKGDNIDTQATQNGGTTTDAPPAVEKSAAEKTAKPGAVAKTRNSRPSNKPKAPPKERTSKAPAERRSRARRDDRDDSRSDALLQPILPTPMPPRVLPVVTQATTATASPATASAPPRAAAADHEVSIPPASDLNEGDEHFFKAGEVADREAREHARLATLPPSSHAGASHDHETPDPRLLQLASPAARARRAKLTKYVNLAVGFCGFLLLAAVVRVAIGRFGHESEPVAHAAPAVVETHAAAVAAPATAPEPPPPPPAAAPATEEPAAPAKSATDEKKDARIALERGKAQDAIEAAERSVDLDPTDGEAWLILGAAYQESGKGTEARRAFTECTKQAKKGPIGECRLMLQ